MAAWTTSATAAWRIGITTRRRTRTTTSASALYSELLMAIIWWHYFFENLTFKKSVCYTSFVLCHHITIVVAKYNYYCKPPKDFVKIRWFEAFLFGDLRRFCSVNCGLIGCPTMVRHLKSLYLLLKRLFCRRFFEKETNPILQDSLQSCPWWAQSRCCRCGLGRLLCQDLWRRRARSRCCGRRLPS